MIIAIYNSLPARLEAALALAAVNTHTELFIYVTGSFDEDFPLAERLPRNQTWIMFDPVKAWYPGRRAYNAHKRQDSNSDASLIQACRRMNFRYEDDRIPQISRHFPPPTICLRILEAEATTSIIHLQPGCCCYSRVFQLRATTTLGTTHLLLRKVFLRLMVFATMQNMQTTFLEGNRGHQLRLLLRTIKDMTLCLTYEVSCRNEPNRD